MDSYWTEARITQLTYLYLQEGMSCAEISAHMGGCTRSAIIGKVWRLKLQKPKVAKPTAAKKAVRTNRSLAFKVIHGIQSQPQPAPIKKAPTFTGLLLNISMADIGPMQCRWIEGNDGLFCGNETEDGVSWCGYHREICFMAPKANRGRENLGTHFANRRRLGSVIALGALT